MRWSEEQTALLRKLWAEGGSASQIARQIAGQTNCRLSRNAVIGRAFRIGCPHRNTTRPPNPNGVKGARIRRRAAVVFVPNSVIKPTKKERLRAELALIAALPPVDPTATMANIGPDVCRYMNGDPQTDATLCGRPAIDGRSYCAHHHKLCYQTSKPKARVRTVEDDERRRFLRETQRRAAFEAGAAL